jgi:hypothetical protein
MATQFSPATAGVSNIRMQLAPFVRIGEVAIDDIA